MEARTHFRPGDLVSARGREWVVLPETRQPNLLKLRPLGGAEDDATLIYVPLEPEQPTPARFKLPDPQKPGSQEAALLLRDALRLKLRAGAGPFRSFGNIRIEPHVYQLVPLLMALKQNIVRLLIADDVGVGKTIEAGLIARELIDRGEIKQLAVICPPHLCEQWQKEFSEKFNIEAQIVRTSTVTRLERELRPDESIFETQPYTIVSLDYIKSDRRRDDFLRTCPEFVIVDEAHTCTQSDTNARHQRYQLLKGLAENTSRRGMVFLTATPHSGDDAAFHNLLSMLDRKFSQLADMPDDDQRRALREELAAYFVQRRRGDIVQWQNDAKFPTRESQEATYRLTGDWGNLFNDVLTYARTIVQRAETGAKLQQRMSWWAALALMRCLSSSPAAALLALRTRLHATENKSEQAKIDNLDKMAKEVVMDETAEDSLSLSDGIPAGAIESPEDADTLRQLIERANALRGPDQDPKLQILCDKVQQLVESGYRPVIFCRFISTAYYVGEELKKLLPENKTRVEVITGALTSDQREERVEVLGDMEESVIPVLVATDCLSEGINLQHYFNAVVHYDLTWNPTRHEQREGRVDRCEQRSKTVRALMIYGENNPVDGAVLRVILKKADKIRKELGVAVPLPADNNKVIDAIMKTVLLSKTDASGVKQEVLHFGDTETEVDGLWRTTRDKMTRTVFAQRRLKPNEVFPEWKKSVSVLGTERDVARFVSLSAQRLGAPLDKRENHFRLPVAHLPKPLQDRLEAIGIIKTEKVVFSRPAPLGVSYIHRTHPLVSTLADYIAEQALDADRPEIGARSGAVFTRSVQKRTTLYLLRLRNQIHVERRNANKRFVPVKSLLAEECLGVAAEAGKYAKLLTQGNVLELLSLESDHNMENEQKTYLIREAIKACSTLEDAFNSVAYSRAEELLADHQRVHKASDTKGLRYTVTPSLPVDKIGVYVFLPSVDL